MTQAQVLVHSPLKGIALITTSLVCYFIGVAGLAAVILALGGIIPLGLVEPLGVGPGIACTINLGLILLFGIQHSVMARRSFKRWLENYLPAALERSLFVLASGLVLLMLVSFWQPVGGVIWRAGGGLNLLLWIGFGFGWLYLLAATFAINHFDLFGLRQAWLCAQGREYTPIPFVEHWMYRISRHPIMLGALIGLWSLPEVTSSRLYLSTGLTLYIAVGLWFEERDLIRQWGDRYRVYRQRVGALITLPGR